MLFLCCIVISLIIENNGAYILYYKIIGNVNKSQRIIKYSNCIKRIFLNPKIDYDYQ